MRSLIDYRPLDQPDILRAVFFPERLWTPTPPGATDHRIPVAGGISVSARFHREGSEAPTVLMFHGNGEVACHYDDLALYYRQAGVNLFVADYRGYGLSDGKPSLGTMMSDARTTYRFLAALLEREGYVGICFVKGRSLGSQPAIEVAAAFQSDQQPEAVAEPPSSGGGVGATPANLPFEKGGVLGLIIESGFASPERVFTRIGATPTAAARSVLDLHRKKLESITLPLLVIHGEEDELVPVELAVELYDAVASNDKEMCLIPRAGHNDLLSVAPGAYFSAFKSFVAKHRVSA